MIQLSYFDFAGGRGEDCRLALHIAGVDFVDHRVRGAEWQLLKPKVPYGGLPVLTVDDQVLAQSNAILRYIGTRFGLHPTDLWEAVRHEAVMASVEDLRKLIDPSRVMSDHEQKKAAREALAAGAIPDWGARMSKQITGPFLSGQTLHVADLKLYMAVRWIQGGSLDHIPTDIFAGQKPLMELYEAVDQHPGVRSWYER